MPLTLSQKTYYELLQEAAATAKPSDQASFEEIWRYPTVLGQGYLHAIELRDGVTMALSRYQLRHHVITTAPAPIRSSAHFTWKAVSTAPIPPLAPIDTAFSAAAWPRRIVQGFPPTNATPG